MVEEAGQVLEAHILASLVDSGSPSVSSSRWSPINVTQSNTLSVSETQISLDLTWQRTVGGFCIYLLSCKHSYSPWQLYPWIVVVEGICSSSIDP